MTPPWQTILSDRPILTNWETSLEALQPRHTWVAHFLYHHIDACVEQHQPHQLTRLERTLLRILTTSTEDSFPLDAVLRRSMTHTLLSEGLVESTTAGWKLTPLGEQALQGDYPKPTSRSHRFAFVERASDHSPHFLHLEGLPPSPVEPPEGWSFDPQHLHTSIDESEAWKQLHCFPSSIQRLHTPSESRFDWRHVLVDTPCEACLLLVESEESNEELRGYVLNAKTWKLEGDAIPLGSLQAWQTVFPEMAEPPETAWRAAWRAWCEEQGLTADEANACSLTNSGVSLDAKMSGELAQRVQPLSEKTWLLTDQGQVRRTARLRIES